ncbi:glycosyltransferase [Sphingobacterium spiritivorum]|uniref:glycosyltransferase n=1 Tax=Sphingobacterium spiritivorum TaxID=258 RepID=UPI003DA39BF6
MNILQVGKFYPVRGGVEKVMYDLMSGLSAQQISCDMLCAATEDHPAGNIILNKYAKLMIIRTRFKFAATMIAPGMISKLRKVAGNYDIIHIHHPDPMACLALYMSGYKGKVVLHWHSDIVKQKTLLKLYNPLQNWLIRRADLIVGTSPVYVQFSPFLTNVQHKVDYIPIGVLPVTADERKVLAIKNKYSGKRIVFSLGRLVEYKGYEYLIRAAQQLDSSYQIVIGGKGPLMEMLRDLIIQLNVQDKVELVGFISDEDLSAYYEACDIFCLSSIQKTEAFAIVQIEAMSCGKPVISTDIPGSGVSWVNKDEVSGLIVDIESADQLAFAIEEICEDEKLNQKFQQGSKERYETMFTRQSMVDRCVRLYRQLLMN